MASLGYINSPGSCDEYLVQTRFHHLGGDTFTFERGNALAR